MFGILTRLPVIDGHGSFLLRATAPDSSLVELPLRRPLAGDRRRRRCGAEPPSGHSATWRVVGIVREIGALATAYATDAAFARAQVTGGQFNALRVVFASKDPVLRCWYGQG